jgi:hypothetical protein
VRYRQSKDWSTFLYTLGTLRILETVGGTRQVSAARTCSEIKAIIAPDKRWDHHGSVVKTVSESFRIYMLVGRCV